MNASRSTSTAAVLAVACTIVISCSRQTLDTSTPVSAKALGGSLTTAQAAELQQDDGQWTLPAKNYSATRFSGLNEITTGNVGKLGVAWTFSTGMVAGHEAAPLIAYEHQYPERRGLLDLIAMLGLAPAEEKAA